MGLVPAAIAGGALISGYLGNQAANTQANAMQNAANTQMAIYQQQRADMMPYYQAGYSALNQIQANMPSYNAPFTQTDFLANQDPGYAFRLQQGENAVNRAAAASGGAVGGSALQSLGNYAQGAASQEYQNAFNRYQEQIQNSYNRLASVAGLGQATLGGGVAAGNAASAGLASSLSGIGAAQAGGQVAIGNAITGGISSGLGVYQGNQYVNALQQAQNPTAFGLGGVGSGVSGGLSQNAANTLGQYQPQGTLTGETPSGFGGSYASGPVSEPEGPPGLIQIAAD